MNFKIFVSTFLLACLLVASTPVALSYTPPTEELSFPMMVLGWDEWSVAAGGVIADQLEAIGIKIEVQPTDDAVMYPALDTRDYGIAEMSIGFEAVPMHIHDYFHSRTDVYGGYNYWSFHNDTMDEVIDELLGTVDRSKLKELIWEAQRIAAENVPFVPLFLADDVHAIRKEWTGYTVMLSGPFSWFNRLTPVNMYATDGKTKFVMAYNRDPETLSPMAASTGRSMFYSILVYDSLLAYNEELELIPWLAEDWSVSADGKTLTFHIRPGVEWHDGQPLTSEDVAFTFEYIQEKEAPEFPFIIELLDSVETPDDLTVVVHLTKSFAWALDTFGTAYIIPKHIWEGQPYDWVITNSTEAVGSGPFKYDSRIEGEWIKLVKNPNYWMEGKPKIEEFTLRVITEESARLMAIKAGEADTERYSVEPPHIAEVLEWPEVKVTRAADIWDYDLFLNNKSPPFNDTQVRKAIAYAINRTEIVKIAALGYGTIEESYMPSAVYGELENPDAKLPIYDPDMANQILDEAGYIDIDGDGIREFPRAAPPTPIWPYAAAGLVIAAVVVVGVYVVVKRRRAAP